ADHSGNLLFDSDGKPDVIGIGLAQPKSCVGPKRPGDSDCVRGSRMARHAAGVSPVPTANSANRSAAESSAAETLAPAFSFQATGGRGGVVQPERPGEPRQGFSPAQALEAAIALHRQGRLAEAETVYRAVLRLTPRHFGCLHYLGMACSQQG